MPEDSPAVAPRGDASADRNVDAEGRADAGDGSASCSEPIAVEDRDDLAAIVDGNERALVNFYAGWSEPCRAVEPAVARVAAETNVAVATVDVDANRPIAAEFGVGGLPTLFVFANGEPVDRYVGVQRPADLLAAVRRRS